AFLAANPKHAKAGAAALALGRCRSQLKQFAVAIPAYERAIASGDAAVLTDARLGLGEAAMQAAQDAKAAPALEAAVKAPLRQDQARLARLWLGQADLELKRYPAAEEAFLKVARDYPRSDLVGAATFGAGLAALRQGNTEVARQRLRTVVD